MAPDLRLALVADDDEFFRAALHTILIKQLGFSEVIEAASLDEAMEQLGSRPGISASFFDLAMPGMRRPANLKAVRECFPDMRMAVVSSSKKRQDILEALEAGAHGYVPKSLGIKDLTTALRTILEGVIFVPPSLAQLEPASKESRDRSRGGDAQSTSVAELTGRQLDVLRLLVQGKSNKEIARNLNLAEGTVKVHMLALFRSMAVHSRAAAAAAGARLL